MRRPFILSFLISLLLLATACTPLGQLKRELKSGGGNFERLLAQEYLDFAQSEAELNRKETRDYFATKGLKAAQGENTPPEAISRWMVDEDAQSELKQARGRLLRVRTDFLQRVAAHRVARAQLFFDCWVVQAYEGTEHDATLPCRAEFINEMESLEQVVTTLGPKPDITLPVRFTILFPLNESALTHDAEYGVSQAIGVASLFPESRVEAVGHADRSGNAEYNLALSQARVASVQAALEAAGIDASRISTSAVGESNPETPTLDGISRNRNRRVEIWILPPERDLPKTDVAAEPRSTAETLDQAE